MNNKEFSVILLIIGVMLSLPMVVFFFCFSAVVFLYTRSMFMEVIAICPFISIMFIGLRLHFLKYSND